MEKRRYPRYKTTKLKALIILSPTADDVELQIEGEVLDMSMSGLKIKLHAPLPVDLGEARIKILLSSAHSKVPMQISGMIRYQSLSTQYGLQFAADNAPQAINDFLFECARTHNLRALHLK